MRVSAVLAAGVAGAGSSGGAAVPVGLRDTPSAGAPAPEPPASGEPGPAWGPPRGQSWLRGRLAAVASAGAQQPTQNWYGPGESDCLIKTEHCDVRSRGADAM